MKKQFYKILSIALISVLALSSCDLTREPENAIPRENSLQSISDAKKWDTGFMTLLRGRVGGYYTYIQDYQADYLNASSEFGNRGGDWHGWLTLTSSSYDAKDIWHSYYVALKNINEFLKLSAEFNLTDEKEIAELNAYKGDAHLLRAYYYSELAIRYGTKYNEATANSDLCVPLILKYDLTELPSRATNGEVYTQIASDIATAKTLLKDRNNAPMSRVLTVDAAYALEARVALTKKDWGTALAASEHIINSKKYPLVAATAESFTNMWRTDNSTEDIVQLYVKKTDEEPNVIGLYGYSATLKACNPDFFPTQGIIDLFDDTDLRKNIYFEKAATKVGLYSMNDTYVISKYKGNAEFNNTADPRYIIRPKLFRMGEVYMIAAEAAYNLPNNEAKAANHLNSLRVSRGLSASTATGVDLYQAIKDERTRELAFEGTRLWDLRRWNESMKRMPPQVSKEPVSKDNIDPIGTAFLSSAISHTLDIKTDNNKWIWPIPYNELTTNVNIKNQQNPGY